MQLSITIALILASQVLSHVFKPFHTLLPIRNPSRKQCEIDRQVLCCDEDKKTVGVHFRADQCVPAGPDIKICAQEAEQNDFYKQYFSGPWCCGDGHNDIECSLVDQEQTRLEEEGEEKATTATQTDVDTSESTATATEETSTDTTFVIATTETNPTSTQADEIDAVDLNTALESRPALFVPDAASDPPVQAWVMKINDDKIAVLANEDDGQPSRKQLHAGWAQVGHTNGGYEWVRIE